jgi:hypothetical protein
LIYIRFAYGTDVENVTHKSLVKYLPSFATKFFAGRRFVPIVVGLLFVQLTFYKNIKQKSNLEGGSFGRHAKLLTCAYRARVNEITLDEAHFHAFVVY